MSQPSARHWIIRPRGQGFSFSILSGGFLWTESARTRTYSYILCKRFHKRGDNICSFTLNIEFRNRALDGSSAQRHEGEGEIKTHAITNQALLWVGSSLVSGSVLSPSRFTFSLIQPSVAGRLDRFSILVINTHVKEKVEAAVFPCFS